MPRILAKAFGKRSFGLALGALASLPGRAEAFHLEQPAPWIVESQDGNPETAGPCGADLSVCYQPTGAVTTFTAGQIISVNWTETVRSDGWFRIALSYSNRADLSDPPVVRDNAGLAVDAAISPATNPDAAPLGITTDALPVLADGLFAHAAADLPGVPYRYTWNLVLPNKPCDKCTLQVTQFLGTKSSGATFAHHCADITILPLVDADAATNPSGAVSVVDDAGGPSPACPAVGEAGEAGGAEDAAAASVEPDGGAEGGSGVAPGSDDAASGEKRDATTGSGGEGGSPAVSPDASPDASSGASGNGGCGCGVVGDAPPAALLGLGSFVALAGAIRRRRFRAVP